MGLLLNAWKCLQGFCFLSPIHACRIAWICQLQFLEAEPGRLGPPGAPARGRTLAVALSRARQGCCLPVGWGVKTGRTQTAGCLSGLRKDAWVESFAAPSQCPPAPTPTVPRKSCMETPPPWMHTRGLQVQLVMESRKQMAAIKGLRSFPLGFGNLGGGKSSSRWEPPAKGLGWGAQNPAICFSPVGGEARPALWAQTWSSDLLAQICIWSKPGGKKTRWPPAWVEGAVWGGGLSVFSQVLTPPPPLLLLGNTGNRDWQSLQIGVILTVITPTCPYLEGSAEIQYDTSKTEGGKKPSPCWALIGESHGLGRGHRQGGANAMESS